MKNYNGTRSKYPTRQIFSFSFILIVCLIIVTELFAVKDQSKDWSIVATYNIPGKASGLAWDGTNIYFGIYGANGNEVYKFDPITGTNELLFTSTILEDAFGMTWDGANLWITDHANSASLPAYAMKFDLAGNVITQFDLPVHYMSGIAYDNGNFWAASYYPNPGAIYKLDNSGAILQQIPSPNQQPWDLCMQGNEIWVVDYDGNMLYKIDQSGAIIESHACENMKPAGVVFDGQYLWYVDGQLSSPSTLYKVDLAGSGTPQINVPVIEYDYGNVTLGDSAVWYCDVYNTGTSDLVITNLIIQNAVPIFVWMTFPQIIPTGSSIQIPIIYKPIELGSLSTLIVVESNDPVTPQVTLEVIGEGVFNGPHIQVLNGSHDYGDVRINATKRWYLEIFNNGDQLLEVTNISIDDLHFFLDENISFPIYIGILETIQLGVWFQPDQASLFEGIAEVNHNDVTQGNIFVNLSGEGIDEEYPMGSVLWNYTINTSFDNSIKAITPILDISGDGVQDVIVCSEDDFIRCFNGNASGTTDVLWENEIGSVYNQNDLCTIEDINNDGYEDIVVGLVGGVRAVKVFSGYTGELIWIYDTHTYGGGGWVYQVWAGFDYNSDGINDVLAATGNDGNNTGPKRVFCLNGQTGNVLWEVYTDGPKFSVIGVDDYTGDGIPDVITGASNLNETQGKVYGINGLTGLIIFEYTTSGSSVWALEQLDDINGDGIKEVIAGDFAGNYYLINPVTGNPISMGSVGTSLLLRFERLEDVNNDGHADIAVAHSGSNAVAINGFNGQNIWLTSLSDKCWNIDKINDVNGDGINDMVAGTLYSSNYCYFIDGVNGNVLYSVNYGEAIDGICSIPDITGDGSWEMVAGGRNGKLTCYSGGLNSGIVSADFMADTTFGMVPFDVFFTDLSSGAVNSWQWDFENDGVIDSYLQNPMHTYTLLGSYSVKLIVGNGILTDTLIKVNYIIADSTVKIQQYLSQSNFIISPNPFIDWVSIEFFMEEDETVTLKIFGTNGEPVVTLINYKFLNAGKHRIYWDGKSIQGKMVPDGLYIGRLEKEGKTSFFRIIRQ